MNSELIPTSSTSLLDASKSTRDGPNDYTVEIVRKDLRFDSFLSAVQVGDAFLITDPASRAGGRWFMCLLPIQRSFSQAHGCAMFTIPGLEVLQAAPTIPRVAKVPLISANSVTTPQKRLEHFDFDDVEFRDS